MKYIPYIALIVSLIAYSGCVTIEEYDILMALFIFLLCGYIFYLKRIFINLFIFFASINNLVDELFFDNTKFEINELIFAIIILIITLARYARKI